MSILTKLRERFPVLIPPTVKADARVAIAEDVIKTLAVGRMTAVQAGYFNLDVWTKASDDSFEAAALSVRDKGKTRCRVCAIGAAAICAVGLYNDAPVMESIWRTAGYYVPHDTDSESMREVLARWFTRKQLDLIECAFEMSDEHEEGGSSESVRETAVYFGEDYGEPRERLEAIMQNIIDNNGTFKPSQRVDNHV